MRRDKLKFKYESVYLYALNKGEVMVFLNRNGSHLSSNLRAKTLSKFLRRALFTTVMASALVSLSPRNAAALSIEDTALMQDTIAENVVEDADIENASLSDIKRSHGVTFYGDLKYDEDFEAFEYVNPDSSKGGVFKLSRIGTFDSFNPFIIKGVPAAGVGLVYETLMESSSDEIFSEYGLLAQWVTVAPDMSFVEYKIRDEARWHDGKKITPEDVIWTFNTLIEKGNPFYKAYYGDVDTVVDLGGGIVRFQFKDGVENRELPLILGQMPVLPKHFWDGKDFSKSSLEKPLGSGPYQIKEFDPGARIRYERVDNHWAKDLSIYKGRYNFQEIEFIYFRDDTVALQAFLSGDVDARQENTAKTWATSYTGEGVKSGEITLAEIPHSLPTGMQGFIYNIRRPIFQDKAVREALSYAFDFEWSNEKFAYGAYKRTHSYFSNSELASYGLPQGKELEILESYKEQLPIEVFEEEYMPPKSDGSGNNRALLRRGMMVLDEAGWALGNDRVREKDGVKLQFEIITQNPAFERWFAPFIQNLKRMGVEARLRVLDTAQYSNRITSFDYDMTIGVFPQSNSPGNEQRDFWHSEKADMEGSRNLIGIKDDVVDALVEKIISAQDREELVASCRALDRVLLWNHYLIPNWHINVWRVAYWDNKLELPEITAPYGLGMIDTWWVDPNYQTEQKQ